MDLGAVILLTVSLGSNAFLKNEFDHLDVTHDEDEFLAYGECFSNVYRKAVYRNYVYRNTQDTFDPCDKFTSNAFLIHTSASRSPNIPNNSQPLEAWK